MQNTDSFFERNEVRRWKFLNVNLEPRSKNLLVSSDGSRESQEYQFLLDFASQHFSFFAVFSALHLLNFLIFSCIQYILKYLHNFSLSSTGSGESFFCFHVRGYEYVYYFFIEVPFEVKKKTRESMTCFFRMYFNFFLFFRFILCTP
jgi:hypothetical protein